MNRTSVLHMNIRPALKLELERLAKLQNRSLSNLVETVLGGYAEGAATSALARPLEHSHD